MKTITSNIYQKSKTFLNKGQKRSVKAKKNIFASVFVKGASIITSFVLVPLTIGYVNPTSYGIWITLSSIIAWFSFFDIGFGNGLRNKFAESVALKDFDLAKRYISTTYAILTLIVIVVLGVFLIVHQFLDWSVLLNAPSSMREELNLTALIVFSFFCIKFILILLNTVLKANQEPAKSSIFDLLGNVVALFIIFILTKTTQGNLVYLSFTLSVAPVLILIVASYFLYAKTSYKRFAPSFDSIDFSLTKGLTSLGLKFFVLQISALIVYSTQNVIISHLFGPEAVTPFNISYKLFFVLTMLFQIISLPFWSAFTEAYVKEDFVWIKGVLYKMRLFWFFSLIAAVGIYIFSPFIINLWIGDSVEVPRDLSLIMGFYVVMHIWMNIYVTFLNGSGKIKLQFYFSIIIGIINVPLTIFFGKLLGLPGIPLSGGIIFALMGCVYYIQTKKILNKKAFGIWNQ